MANTGTTLVLNKSIYLIPNPLISADSAQLHYRLIVALTEEVSMISQGLREGTYRFVYS
jgi:hypothetical protein